MTTIKYDPKMRFHYGDTVMVKPGVVRKPWEWMGSVQMVSGDKVAILWRMILPGSENHPLSTRTLDELILVVDQAS